MSKKHMNQPLSQHPIDRVCQACEHGEHDTGYSDAVHMVETCACACNKECGFGRAHEDGSGI